MNGADIFAPMVAAVAVASGIFQVAHTGLSQMHPPEVATYFEVSSIRAERQGDGARLWVDRTIHLPVHMSYTVRVMERTAQGWREYCEAQNGPFLYQPDAVLDQPVSLSWWTGGKCDTLPEGRARIVTTWAPTIKGVEPVSYTVEVAG